MPKIFEYECLSCSTIVEEWFGNLETPPTDIKAECQKCGKKRKHRRIVSRNKHRWYINDSPYGG